MIGIKLIKIIIQTKNKKGLFVACVVIYCKKIGNNQFFLLFYQKMITLPLCRLPLRRLPLRRLRQLILLCYR